MDESHFLWMGCVGSCFVEPHGLSCNFGASEKFASIFFYWTRTEVAKLITVGIMLLDLVGWMGAFFLKSSLGLLFVAIFCVCGKERFA